MLPAAANENCQLQVSGDDSAPNYSLLFHSLAQKSEVLVVWYLVTLSKIAQGSRDKSLFSDVMQRSALVLTLWVLADERCDQGKVEAGREEGREWTLNGRRKAF
jgi:hypothetical protein